MVIAARPQPVRSRPTRRGRGEGDEQARGDPRPPRLILPRWETPVPAADIARGDGQQVVEFVETYGRITKDSIAGRSGAQLIVRPWQRHVIERIYARGPDGKRRHRRAMIGVARKNGKTGVVAPVALYGLMAEGDGAQVFSCAADREQAKLVFTAAKRTVEMDPELRAVCKVYRDTIEYVPGGSIYRALSSEAYTKEGLGPSLVVFDELHALPDRGLYDVMSLAMGASVDPLMIIVTTAGVRVDRNGQDTIAHQLYQLGRRIATGEIVDPTYYMAWWEPTDPGNAPADRRAWAQANPSLGDILDPADMASALPPATPENEYRTKRLNQWVVAAKSWLPFGAWDARAAKRVVAKDEQIVLGFDGSWTNDSTALVGCTLKDPHLFVLGLWERPLDGTAWTVPSNEVEDALLAAMTEYDVVEVACDPALWREQLARWTELGLPVTEWPTNSLPRIVPACREFYSAVVEKRLTHDGDPRLARHVANAIVKEDRYGQRIVKDTRNRKIDLAVAAVIAYDRAHTAKPAVSWAFETKRPIAFV